MFIKAKHANWLFIFLLIFTVGIIAYFNRWVFAYKFEPEYWENYYYESQWNVANSKRVIPDGGVYRYIGYRLVNGENPFNVDYWVPPLGKYWYGWGAKYLGNPYLISFAYYLTAIAIFWLIARLIFKDKSIIILTTLLFALNPLVVEQISKTMLDLPMTIFFMMTILGLYYAVKKQQIAYVILAGLSLGLMAGVKPPYYVPMIAIIGTGWLYIKKVKAWWCFLPTIAVGYLLAYACYFIKHPNPIPFIRLHEKIIEFQKNSSGSHDTFNIFRVIFLNKYKGFWEGGKTITTTNWSVVLPLGTLYMGWVWLKIKKIKADNDKIILLLLLGSLYVVMNLFIDFWPRYLVPLIPIYILLLGYLLRNRPKIIIILIVGMFPSLFFLLFPKPVQFLEDFNSKQAGGFYRETYRMLDSTTTAKFSETNWMKIGKEINNNQGEPVKENNQWRLRIK